MGGGHKDAGNPDVAEEERISRAARFEGCSEEDELSRFARGGLFCRLAVEANGLGFG
jgi:hypothetical protein